MLKSSHKRKKVRSTVSVEYDHGQYWIVLQGPVSRASILISAQGAEIAKEELGVEIVNVKRTEEKQGGLGV